MWSVALGWLAELMELIGSFIPQCYHHTKLEIAVSITRGKKIRVRKPGIIWYLPFWTTLYHREANVQTMEINAKGLLSKDGCRIQASAIIRYHFNIDNPENIIKALIETDDVESAIEDEISSVLCKVLTECSTKEMQTDRKKINSRLTQSVKKTLQIQYGVEIDRFQLADYSTCDIIYLTGPTSPWNNIVGSEEE